MTELMKKTGDTIRQGDVLLVRVTKAAVTKAHKPVPLERGRIVLADGETSLHQHVVRGDGVCLLQAEGVSDRVLTVGAELAQLLTEGGELGPGIERHGAIPVPPGTYRVVIQREWSSEEVRVVTD
jgi:hypothetical protein